MVYKFAILAVLALSQCAEAGPSPCVCARSGRPVCGSDGNTYRSECALACHNSETGAAVTVAAAGACSTCICTLDYRPLCGSDGKTYPNQCSFDCFKTDSLRVMYDGPCLQGQMLVSEKQCACTDDNRPVCANNGQTYPNWCTFQCEMAKDSTLRVLREGACTQQINPTSWRPQVNTAVPSYGPSTTRSPYESNTQRVPSYGSGTNRTPYGSNTQRVPSYESYPQNMQYGSSTPRVPSYGSTTPTAPSFGSQGNNCVCPRVMKPVCGTDGQTYNNECLLDCNNVPLARLGRCDQW